MQAGADLVTQVGVGKGTNLSDLGSGDAVLVIATDLEEEAPLYRIRLKQARERGARVFVANARSTRMDDFVRRNERLRYETGQGGGVHGEYCERSKGRCKCIERR